MKSELKWRIKRWGHVVTCHGDVISIISFNASSQVQFRLYSIDARRQKTFGFYFLPFHRLLLLLLLLLLFLPRLLLLLLWSFSLTNTFAGEIFKAPTSLSTHLVIFSQGGRLPPSAPSGGESHHRRFQTDSIEMNAPSFVARFPPKHSNEAAVGSNRVHLAPTRLESTLDAGAINRDPWNEPQLEPGVDRHRAPAQSIARFHAISRNSLSAHFLL